MPFEMTATRVALNGIFASEHRRRFLGVGLLATARRIGGERSRWVAIGLLANNLDFPGRDGAGGNSASRARQRTPPPSPFRAFDKLGNPRPAGPPPRSLQRTVVRSSAPGLSRMGHGG